MELKNEYLIVIEKDSSAFYELCRTTKQFNDFIESNKLIKITKNKIIYNKKTYFYLVEQGDINDKEQRFFHLTLTFDEEEKNLKNYKELNREIKNTFSKKTIVMETLRDDISFHYSHKAYALLHRIENLMRKFITYFMITKVGKEWFQEHSPQEVEKAINNSKRVNSSILQKLDFIHLGDFLFKSYHKEKTDDLFKKIQSLKENEFMNKNELDKYISESNWNKFFKNEINCEEEYLNKRWKNLYELRNKIAHTSDFTEGDYQDIERLVNEVKEKIEEAFKKISNIQIDDEEKMKLSEDIIKNTNEYIGAFIEQWIEIEKNLRILTNGNGDKYIPPMQSFRILERINPLLCKKVREISQIKNQLVHGDLSLDSKPIPLVY